MPEKQVYGDLNLNSNKLKGLAAGVASGEACRFDEFDELVRKDGTNFLLGENSGDGLTTGINNVLVGNDSGLGITSGERNVFIGVNSGKVSTEASRNIFIGLNSCASGIITGLGNIAIGYAAGIDLEGAAEYNVLLGHETGDALTTGSRNVFIGNYSGKGITGDDKFYLQNDELSSDVLMYGDFATGFLAIGKSMALVAKLNVNGAIALLELSSDPTLTENGTGAFWVSDGTGSGAAGDLMYSYRTGGSTTAYIVQAA